MACFLDSLDKLFVTESANVSDRLLMRAVTTEHCDSFNLLVNRNRAYDVAIVATEASSTAAVTVPSKGKFHMLAHSFSWKFVIGVNLRDFEGWIVVFETHIIDLY